MRVLRRNRNCFASQFNDQFCRAKTQIGRVVQQLAVELRVYMSAGVVSRFFFSVCGVEKWRQKKKNKKAKD